MHPVIPFGKLILQHVGVLCPDFIKVIPTGGNVDHFLVFGKVDMLVQKGKLEVNGRIEII